MSNVPMTRPGEMLAFHDGKFPGNAFVGLEGGRVLFSNGTHFSVSADGGVTWGEPYPGLDENGDPLTLRNCSMVNLSGGAIGMATKRTRPGTTRLYESQMVFRRSEDEGRTWSALTLMNHWMLAAHALNDTMIRTQSGRILLPVYFGIGQGGFHQEGAPFPGVDTSTASSFRQARTFTIPTSPPAMSSTATMKARPGRKTATASCSSLWSTAVAGS